MNQIRDCREGTWQFGWAKTCMSLKDRTSQTTFKIAGKGTWDLVDLYTFIKELGTWRAQCKIVRKAQNEDKRLIYNERVIRRSHHPITETNEPNNMIVKSAEAQSSTHQKQTVLHSRWKCNLHSRNATDAWPALERWRPLMTSAVTLTIAPQMRHLSNYSMAPCIGDHPQQKTAASLAFATESRRCPVSLHSTFMRYSHQTSHRNKYIVTECLENFHDRKLLFVCQEAAAWWGVWFEKVAETTSPFVWTLILIKHKTKLSPRTIHLHTRWSTKLNVDFILVDASSFPWSAHWHEKWLRRKIWIEWNLIAECIKPWIIVITVYDFINNIVSIEITPWLPRLSGNSPTKS